MKVNFNAGSFDLNPRRRVPDIVEFQKEEKAVSYK